MTNLSIIGTTPESLTGYNINAYFYNGKWLRPLITYIDGDKILPTRVRVTQLPVSALVIKAWPHYAYHRTNQNSWDTSIPRYYTLNFTTDSILASPSALSNPR